jgi:hypothetical protein
MSNKQCKKCLKCEVYEQKKIIKCLIKNQHIMKNEISELQCQLSELMEVVCISNNGIVNIGSDDQPVNNIYATNIVSNNYDQKGINLDDTTSALVPSFNSFPKLWINADVPISSSRTYHYNFNNPNWIKWFVENHIEVMVGITLDNYQAELDAFSSDYLSLNLSLKTLYDSYIIAISVGNEEPVSKIPAMNSGMQYAKMLINSSKLPKNAKVTTVLQELPDWISPTYPPYDARFTNNFMQLASNLEIICFNMYDGYTNPSLPLETRLSWTSDIPNNRYSLTLNGFGAIRYAMEFSGLSTKPFWCTEFGWQSSGSIPGSSVENLKTYYSNFLNFNSEIPFYPQSSPQSVNPPNKLFYFTIRDVPNMNETFGLYTSNSNLTPKF